MSGMQSVAQMPLAIYRAPNHPNPISEHLPPKKYEKMARGGDSTLPSQYLCIYWLYLQLLRRQCCLKRNGALGGPASAMGCSNIWTHIYGLLVAKRMIAWPSIRRGNSWEGVRFALKRHGLKHGKSIPKKGACRLCARVCRCSPAEPLYPRDSPPEWGRQTSWASCVAGINYLYRSCQIPSLFCNRWQPAGDSLTCSNWPSK